MSWWKTQKGDNQFEQGARALEAFAHVLKALGHHTFDTDDIPAEKWSEQCDGWAQRVEGLLANMRGEAGAKEVRADWPALVALIGTQEANRAEQVNTSLGALREVVQVCGRGVSDELQASAQESSRIEEQSRAMSAALATNDLQAVQNAASALLTALSETNASRRARAENRVRLMGDQVRAIKAELSEPRIDATMDSATGLYNREALGRHLQRLVDLGPLFATPPSLILVQLNLTMDQDPSKNDPNLLKQIGVCVAASFLRKQDFVARFSQDRLAVALVDTVLPNVDMLCERLEQSLKEMQSPDSASRVRLTIGASVWGEGESAEQWVQRVVSLIPDITSSHRRSVKPPPGQ
ncbi:MAG TPA: diguanylate cyclase [Polyangiaceae bacterium]|nr:diguanylate cyclase [Polyangiaceae bacterium]